MTVDPEQRAVEAFAEPSTAEESPDAGEIGDATQDGNAESDPSSMSLPAPILELRDLGVRGWMAIGGGVLLAIGFTWLRTVITGRAESELDTEFFELHSSTIASGLSGLAVIALLTSAGWRHLAGVSGTWVRQGLIPSGLVIVACVLPLVTILDSSWETPWRVGWVTIDHLADSFFVEVLFRGLVFVFIANALRRHHYGVLWSTVVTALIYGIVGGGWSMLLWGTLLSIVFTMMTLDCRSIWPAVALHGLFEAFSDLPFDAQGVPGSTGWRTVSLLLLAVAAIVALRRLAAIRDPWTALMSVNVAPLVPAAPVKPLGLP
ncbi:MAG: CPBP family intramembrane metalloprotease [Actinomycetia bacterium]|nr:CPBP family intramembrane metalloprotease [Actinomycetes bacterium]